MPINGSAQQLRALHDTVRMTLSTLKNLDISTKSWDLGKKTRPVDAPTKIPTLGSVVTFIERSACMLETMSA